MKKAMNLKHQVIPISFSVVQESVAEHCVIQRKTVLETRDVKPQSMQQIPSRLPSERGTQEL